MENNRTGNSAHPVLSTRKWLPAKRRQCVKGFSSTNGLFSLIQWLTEFFKDSKINILFLITQRNGKYLSAASSVHMKGLLHHPAPERCMNWHPVHHLPRRPR